MEELIAKLDPERSYGEMTYDQVVAEVRAGTLLIEEGLPVPVLKDAVTHRVVSGTGLVPAQYHGLTAKKPRQVLTKSSFIERAKEDFDEVYDTLIHLALVKHEVKAIALYLEYTFGRPVRTPASDPSTIVEKFLEHMERMAPPGKPIIDA